MVDVRVSDISSYFFCPLRVYLSNGLGLRANVDVKASHGSIVHDLYLSLSRVSATYVKKGIEIEKAVRIGLREVFSSVVSRWPEYSGFLYDIVDDIVEYRVINPFVGLPVETEVYLEDDNIGLYGRLDMLEGVYPVEVKYKSKLSVSDVYQLVAYVVLLRKVRGIAPKYGFIDLLPLQRVKVHINDPLIDKTMKIVEKVKEASVTPILNNRGDCNKCDYNFLCRLFFGL